MDRLAFHLDGLRCGLRGDAAFLEAAAVFYAGFPPADAAAPGDPELAWEGNRCRWRFRGGGEGAVRTAGPSGRLRATHALLLRLLSEAVPGLLCFHGNALAAEDGAGAVLLLLGGSGSGKSTLSRALLGLDPGLRLLGEDLLLVEPQPLPRLIPFPRAASLRGDSLPAVAPLRPSLAPYPCGRIARGSVPLSRALEVFLLSAPPSRPAPYAGEERASTRLILSHAAESCLPELSAAGLPPPALEDHPLGAALVFGRCLSVPETGCALRILAAAEAAVLASDGGGAEIGARIRRPSRPSCSGIGAAAGLRGLLSQRLQPGLRPEEAGWGAGFLLDLAGWFAAARFHRLVPGGTPDETARLVLAAAGSSRTR